MSPFTLWNVFVFVQLLNWMTPVLTQGMLQLLLLESNSSFMMNLSSEDIKLLLHLFLILKDKLLFGRSDSVGASPSVSRGVCCSSEYISNGLAISR